ncbi:hypothetical protein TSMEX_003461, partial [Taenia solium]
MALHEDENEDPCEGVRCGYNARCVEGRCVCEPGFSGDPNYECKAEKTANGVPPLHFPCVACKASSTGEQISVIMCDVALMRAVKMAIAFVRLIIEAILTGNADPLMLAVVSVAATMPDVLRAGANVSPVMWETRTPNAGPVS